MLIKYRTEAPSFISRITVNVISRRGWRFLFSLTWPWFWLSTVFVRATGWPHPSEDESWQSSASHRGKSWRNWTWNLELHIHPVWEEKVWADEQRSVRWRRSRTSTFMCCCSHVLANTPFWVSIVADLNKGCSQCCSLITTWLQIHRLITAVCTSALGWVRLERESKWTRVISAPWTSRQTLQPAAPCRTHTLLNPGC